MSHPLLSETLLTLNAAAKRLGVHHDTVRRWAARKQLDALKVGASWRTSVEALDRFLARRNPQAAAPPERTPAERRKASEAAERALIAMGC